MRRGRVYHVLRNIPWISALIALSGPGPDTPPEYDQRAVFPVPSIAAAPPSPPDTAFDTRPTTAVRRQRRARVLEWAIQTLRVLDAVLQAIRVLMK